MEYKYKAFISYRHLAPDMQAAEKLQKLLEGYKPPKTIGKTKENWRIFRDVSELQSSSDLSEEIKNAIESSEYLIVICSPNYTKSKWCLQELTRFRALHDNTNQNIITLLVDGLPQEAFPEELTYTEVTTTDEKGESVRVKVEVEPLAANITAETLKESLKKLNTEYLRIAAPLLGCDFNDLFQREKRREAARRRRIFGGAFAVLSLITTNVSLNGTGQEPVAAAAVSENAFAVLCRDSQIYEMCADGFTGRSCPLDFKDETENSIRESNSADAGLFRSQTASDGRVFAVWNSTQAWLLDAERFTVRYRVDHFACAPAEGEIVFIRDVDRNQIGSFPIYTTAQLLDTAHAYLSALGEE